MEKERQYEFVQLPRCILEELLKTVLHIAQQPELSDTSKQTLADMARKVLQVL